MHMIYININRAGSLLIEISIKHTNKAIASHTFLWIWIRTMIWYRSWIYDSVPHHEIYIFDINKFERSSLLIEILKKLVFCLYIYENINDRPEILFLFRYDWICLIKWQLANWSFEAKYASGQLMQNILTCHQKSKAKILQVDKVFLTILLS